MSQPTLDNRARFGWSPTKLMLGLSLGMVLGTAAVTAPSAWQLPGIELATAGDGSVFEETAHLKRRLAAIGQPVELALVEGLTAELRAAFPERPERTALYTEARAAADLAGIELQQLVFTPSDKSLGPASADTWIFSTTADLVGTATPAELAFLVDLLRASGRPTLVRSFTLRRIEPTSAAFEFQLRLAFPFRDLAPTEQERELDQGLEDATDL